MGGVAGGLGAVCISSANDVTVGQPIPCIERANSCSPGQDYVTCGAAPGTATKITEVLDTFGCNDPSIRRLATLQHKPILLMDNGCLSYQRICDGALVSDNVLSDPLMPPPIG